MREVASHLMTASWVSHLKNLCQLLCSCSLCYTNDQERKDCRTLSNFKGKLVVLDHVHFVVGHPQKKGLSPIVKPIMSVNSVSCVDQLSFVLAMTKVPVVAQNNWFKICL